MTAIRFTSPLVLISTTSALTPIGLMQTEPEKIDRFLGMPMRWERENAFKGLWNKEDARIFPPKHFGIGWSINFHALGRKMGLIAEEPEEEEAS